MVVITAAAMTAFWTGETQMRLDRQVRQALELDGIETFESLADYEKADLLAIKKSIDRDGDIPHFGHDSFQRLCTACEASRHWKLVGREITAEMMHYNNILRLFEQDWKTIVALEDRTEPEVPTISRSLPPLKWAPAFAIAMKSTTSTRVGVPLYYVIREDATPSNPAPNLLLQGTALQTYAEEYGSMRDERIARASHTHPSFQMDNELLFNKIDLATRGTKYAPSIEPFRKRSDGRRAYFALMNHYLGDDRWETEITKYDGILHEAKWKGTGNQTLENYISIHRNAYQHLCAAAEHVPHQLPNAHTRVKHLLQGIISSDARLNAAIAYVQADAAIKGDFERASAQIQPHCPITKRLAGSKRTNVEISATDANIDAHVGAVNGGLTGRGPNTGVHLRYHTTQEYKKLTKEQKEELLAWRKTAAGQASIAAGKGSKQNKKQKTAQVSAAVIKKEVAKALEAKQEEEKKASAKSDQENRNALLASILAQASKDKALATKLNIGAVTADDARVATVDTPAPAAEEKKKKRSTTLDPNFLSSILEKVTKKED